MTGTQTVMIMLTRDSAPSASRARPSSARSGATSEYGNLFLFHYFRVKYAFSKCRPARQRCDNRSDCSEFSGSDELDCPRGGLVVGNNKDKKI